VIMTRAEHLAAVAIHLDRAAALTDRFHGPIGVGQAQLIGAQLDIALANAHSIAALALAGADEGVLAAMAEMAAVQVAVPDVPQPQSGLIVPQ
jgi:hypothetical protein